MNAFDGCTLSVKSDASAPTKSDGSFKQPSIVLKPNQTLGNRQQRELLPLLDLPANSDVVFHLGYSPAGCGGLNSVTDKLLPAKVGYRIDGEGTFYLLVGPQGTVLANASTQKPMSGAGEFSLGCENFFPLKLYTYI
jgi:hypothetical protein